jgi:hypothetical protein
MATLADLARKMDEQTAALREVQLQLNDVAAWIKTQRGPGFGGSPGAPLVDVRGNRPWHVSESGDLAYGPPAPLRPRRTLSPA